MPSDTFAPTRRAVVAASAAVGIGAALGTPGAASAATASGEDITIRSGALEVRVAAAFPRIVSYTDRATGAVLHGQEDEVTSVLIDNAERTPTVTTTAGDTAVAYRLAFDGGTTIDIEITVTDRQVTWQVTEIADTDALPVGTLRIPGLALLSVRSDQPGAQLLAARIQLDKSKSGDTLLTPTADSPADTATGCAYAVVAHHGLAGAVETNTVYDKPVSADGTTWEPRRRPIIELNHPDMRSLASAFYLSWRYGSVPPKASPPPSTAANYVAGDRKRGTRFQRMCTG